MKSYLVIVQRNGERQTLPMTEIQYSMRIRISRGAMGYFLLKDGKRWYVVSVIEDKEWFD